MFRPRFVADDQPHDRFGNRVVDPDRNVGTSRVKCMRYDFSMRGQLCTADVNHQSYEDFEREWSSSSK
jgi:hypothetical protein